MANGTTGVRTNLEAGNAASSACARFWGISVGYDHTQAYVSTIESESGLNASVKADANIKYIIKY